MLRECCQPIRSPPPPPDNEDLVESVRCPVSNVWWLHRFLCVCKSILLFFRAAQRQLELWRKSESSTSSVKEISCWRHGGAIGRHRDAFKSRLVKMHKVLCKGKFFFFYIVHFFVFCRYLKNSSCLMEVFTAI